MSVYPCPNEINTTSLLRLELILYNSRTDFERSVKKLLACLNDVELKYYIDLIFSLSNQNTTRHDL